MALGHHAPSKLTRYVKIPGGSVAPIIEALVAAELVERVQDPIRDNRPFYYPADPLIRFHYAIIRRHHARLGRHDTDVHRLWGDLRATFDAQVVGPTFESTSRFWATHFAEPGLFGEQPVHVGPTVTRAPDGSEIQVDVIAAADDSDSPSGRTILVLGEAKSGERLTETHVRRLEAARSGFGARAAEAKLILFGTEFAPDLEATTRRRRDLELVGLPRLYGESGAR